MRRINWNKVRGAASAALGLCMIVVTYHMMAMDANMNQPAWSVYDIICGVGGIIGIGEGYWLYTKPKENE